MQSLFRLFARDASSFVVAALLCSGLAAAATITVTTTSDDVTANDGSVSLREAITAINAGNDLGDPDIIAQNPGTFGSADAIHFNIAGTGVHTISVGSSASAPGMPLPAIAKPVLIDGLTQPGSSANTLAVGDNAVLRIVLDGTSAGGASTGITLSDHSASKIRGLVIGRFSNRGILMNGTGGGHLITSNFIGTNAAGTAAAGNQFDGLSALDPSSNNTIGGTTPAARNIISGNAVAGVTLESFDSGFTNGNVVQGNYIGVAADGVTPLGNTVGSQTGWGVLIVRNSSGNAVGGSVAGAGNIIAFNAGPGVTVFSAAAINNSILGNSIHGNGRLGIDLGDDGPTPNHSGGPIPGPNNFQNFPVITSATLGSGTVAINGTLNSAANTTYRVELFSNAACNAASSFGQGQTFVGFLSTTTNGSGNAAFSGTFPVPSGQTVFSATATDPLGNTSEFAMCFTVAGGTPPVLVSAVSRKVHGAAGTFSLPLSAVATNPTTEPRIGPAQTIVFTFNKAVNGATATITEGIATAAAPTFSGSDVIVNLTGVNNQQYVTISLTNVASVDGGTGGTGSVRVGFLLGDINQNRVVSVADLGLVNAQLAQIVTATNYLKDVNASGTLSVADKGLTNANLTRNLPAP